MNLFFRTVNLFVSILIVLWNGALFAAPHPATSSSAFIDSENGTFRSQFGFTISAGKTNWIHSKVSPTTPQIVTSYRAPLTQHGVQARLTVRVDKLKKRTSLKKYVKRWKKEYPRFGFNILNAKKVKVAGKRGFLLDLLNKEGQKQLRQVVFLKHKTAVILTCRDHPDSFRKTVNHCNNIMRSFHWN